MKSGIGSISDFREALNAINKNDTEGALNAIARLDYVNDTFSYGVNTNEHTWNITLLHLAALRGMLSVVRLLIQRNADPLARTSGYEVQTPLSYSLMKNYQLGGDGRRYPELHKTLISLVDFEPKALLYSDNLSMTPLHYVSSNSNNIKLLDYFLSKGKAIGINVNAARVDGVTPLHIAVIFSNIEGTKRLVAAGANVFALDDSGKRPSQRASNQAIKDYLLGIEAQQPFLEAPSSPHVYTPGYNQHSTSSSPLVSDDPATPPTPSSSSVCSVL